MIRRIWQRTQLRTRVLAGVLALTLAALIGFDVAAVSELRQYLLKRTDSTLAEVLDITGPRLDRLLRLSDAGKPAPILVMLGPAVYDYLAFIPHHGPAVTLDAAAGASPELPGDLAGTERHAQTVGDRGGSDQLRVRARAVDNGTLVVAASLDDLNHTVSRLQDIVAIGSAAAMAVIAVGVVLVIRRGLRPLEAMARQADRINAGDLTNRVSPDNAAGEVGRLGLALNSMLARIETAVAEREASQELTRQFFADASHELRTPLASLRANAELYEQGVLSQPAQVDEAMRRIALEALRMSKLVDDMLRLARLDQHPAQQHEPVDLTELLQGCLERAAVAEPQRTWRSDIAPHLTVVGDAELLRRAVDNLIANVHTHTPANTAATLTAAHRGATVVIEVSDDGPGVSMQHISRIFDRFYRGDSPPSHPGSGLGLAIVTETAAAHEGHVTAAANHPNGLRVCLTLPWPARSGPLDACGGS